MAVSTVKYSSSERNISLNYLLQQMAVKFCAAKEAAADRMLPKDQIVFTDHALLEKTEKSARNTHWSDKLGKTNPERYAQIWAEHFPFNQLRSFHSMTPSQIELFLQHYCSKPNLKIIQIELTLNLKKGCEIWRFVSVSH